MTSIRLGRLHRKTFLCTTFEDSNRQSVAKPSETTETFRFFTFGYSRNDGYFAQRQRIYRTSGYRNSKEPAGTYFLYRHTGRNHVYEPFEFLSENQRNFRYVAQRLPEDNPFEDGCRIAFTTRIPDQRNLRIGRVQFFFLFHEMF